MSHLYLPSVTGAPPDLAAPNKGYRCLARTLHLYFWGFVAFYFSSMALFAWWVWYAASHLIDEAARVSFLMVLPLIPPMLILLFMTTGLFHRRVDSRSLEMEIIPAIAPELFAFLDTLCKRLCAPKPRKVSIRPEPVAAVFFDTSFLYRQTGSL